jgi:RNA polymerase sigma-70 factor (ECF subfamily)
VNDDPRFARTDLRDDLDRYVEQLQRYAFALTGNRDRAQDLVQDCLVRALANSRRFVPGTNLRAWLFTLLHNLYVSEARSQSRRSDDLSVGDLGEEAVADGGQLVHVEFRDMVASLRALDPDQRAVILLVGVEGLSYKEAADVLEVPIGTVMSRLSRGREALRGLTEGRAPRRLKTVGEGQGRG